jgi:hypothetical protein
MKLSEKTLDVLKNFSAINPNMVFKPGKTISTISEAKNIMANATIEDEIPAQFGIYDLTEFLSTLTLVSDPDLEFTKDSVVVTDGATSIRYFYSAPELLTAPTKQVNMPKADVTLKLTADAISKIKKAASVLGHATMVITGKKGKVTLSVADLQNETANKYSIVVDENNSCQEPFTFVMVIGNLKMLPGDYDVSISSKLISSFQNTSVPVQYWIALEKSSAFGSK